MVIDVLARDIGKLIKEGKESVLTEAYQFDIKLKGGNFLSALLFETANRIHYSPEPEGRDDWQSVEETLLKKTGDCEDFTILIGAVLLRAGYPVLLKLTASKDEFDHIYPLTWDGKSWVALDGTLHNIGLNFEGSYVKSLMYNLNGGLVKEGDFLSTSYLGWFVAVVFIIFILIRIYLRG